MVKKIATTFYMVQAVGLAGLKSHIRIRLKSQYIGVEQVRTQGFNPALS